jgi:hypothetical protein
MRNQLQKTAIDELLELYCEWREECATVQVAYESSCLAPPEDRALAHTAYLAALDREAAGARMYGEQISRVSSRFAAASPDVLVGKADQLRQDRRRPGRLEQGAA